MAENGDFKSIARTVGRPTRRHIGRHNGGDRMITIIFPLVTMAVGFLLGVIVTDSVGENKRITELERKYKRLERKVDGC